MFRTTILMLCLIGAALGSEGCVPTTEPLMKEAVTYVATEVGTLQVNWEWECYPFESFVVLEDVENFTAYDIDGYEVHLSTGLTQSGLNDLNNYINKLSLIHCEEQLEYIYETE